MVSKHRRFLLLLIFLVVGISGLVVWYFFSSRFSSSSEVTGIEVSQTTKFSVFPMSRKIHVTVAKYVANPIVFPMVAGTPDCLAGYSFEITKSRVDLTVAFQEEACYQGTDATTITNQVIYALMQQVKNDSQAVGDVMNNNIRADHISLLPEVDQVVPQYVEIHKQ